MAVYISGVGGGDLGVELKLEAVYEDLDVPTIRYEPETFPALYLRFSENMPMATVFQSGKYNISGGPDIKSLHKTNSKIINKLDQLLDENISSEMESIEIRNLVYKKRFDREFELSELAIQLGLKFTEYEPEQFPGIIYRPENENYIFLIYSTGNVILTGIKRQNKADGAFCKLHNAMEIDNW
jgi:transcription initiation factor TFIID TATA-box-binding protein